MNIKFILFYLFLNSLTLHINFKMLLVRNQVKRFLKFFAYLMYILHNWPNNATSDFIIKKWLFGAPELKKTKSKNLYLQKLWNSIWWGWIIVIKFYSKVCNIWCCQCKDIYIDVVFIKMLVKILNQFLKSLFKIKWRTNQ